MSHFAMLGAFMLFSLMLYHIGLWYVALYYVLMSALQYCDVFNASFCVVLYSVRSYWTAHRVHTQNMHAPALRPCFMLTSPIALLGIEPAEGQ